MTNGRTAARRVLICDDDAQILRGLKAILRQEGFKVVTSESAEEALGLASTYPPDAVILDLVLPDGDGISVCQAIRAWSGMPILVLSALGEDREKVRALNTGADDFIDKPFAPKELIARLNAVLRRSQGDSDKAIVAVAGLEIDLAAQEASREGEPVHLTPTEFALLRALARNRGRLMTHQMLLLEVWGPAFEDETQVLRVHIANLRSKIEHDPVRPRYITTDAGIGYRFAA